MAVQVQEQPVVVRRAHSGRWVGGLVLIALGLFALIAQLVPDERAGLVFMPMLGGVFLVAGLGSRNVGLLVPGGVLSGLGVGTVLLEEHYLLGAFGYYYPTDGPVEAGILLACLAGGFALVSLLSPFTRQGFRFWPLFPATILATVGGLLMAGDEGLRVLELIGKYWPVVLIAGGLLLIVRRRDA